MFQVPRGWHLKCIRIAPQWAFAGTTQQQGLRKGWLGSSRAGVVKGADDQWREDSLGAEQTTGRSVSDVTTSGKYDSQKGGTAGEG